jgi:predicted ATPase
MMRGWLHVETGEVKAGLTQLYQGLEVIQSLRARSLLPWYLLLLAEVHGKQGQIDLSLRAIASGLDAVNQHEIFVCESELYRLKGELLLQQSVDNQVEAEACFHQAISIAQHQQAKSWELRAATSLARLWRSQGKRDEARELLAPVYSWFTEGFDTADLIEAKNLLDELGG